VALGPSPGSSGICPLSTFIYSPRRRACAHAAACSDAEAAAALKSEVVRARHCRGQRATSITASMSQRPDVRSDSQMRSGRVGVSDGEAFRRPSATPSLRRTCPCMRSDCASLAGQQSRGGPRSVACEAQRRPHPMRAARGQPGVLRVAALREGRSSPARPKDILLELVCRPAPSPTEPSTPCRASRLWIVHADRCIAWLSIICVITLGMCPIVNSSSAGCCPKRGPRSEPASAPGPSVPSSPIPSTALDNKWRISVFATYATNRQKRVTSLGSGHPPYSHKIRQSCVGLGISRRPTGSCEVHTQCHWASGGGGQLCAPVLDSRCPAGRQPVINPSMTTSQPTRSRHF
jgi:hypothetical protein